MDINRWKSLSFASQIGNIGSEISRFRNCLAKDGTSNQRKSLDRTLEMIDLTLDDRRNIGKFKELARLREVIASFYCEEKVYTDSLGYLEQYCTDFVLKELRNK